MSESRGSIILPPLIAVYPVLCGRIDVYGWTQGLVEASPRPTKTSTRSDFKFSYPIFRFATGLTRPRLPGLRVNWVLLRVPSRHGISDSFLVLYSKL
ncbi:hypothetical protein IW261DRAFT_441777 [Armillaria novae-zelandiae]|uniref:Uncharacterized protein n=1 Tax=Armillaria novae-zelandiae TaxID=153914 RepID=A0AA39P2L6_9AGAR|nr:hypothetical protein IW261DRAFT_441777 [Armillaria novae-zelandiae]